MADRFDVGDVIRIMVARRLVEKNTKEIKKKS